MNKLNKALLRTIKWAFVRRAGRICSLMDDWWLFWIQRLLYPLGILLLYSLQRLANLGINLKSL